MSAAQPLHVTDDQPHPSAIRSDIARIIESGQQVEFATGNVLPLMAVATFGMTLLWASFTPLDFGQAGWLALIPLCLLVRPKKLPRRSYAALMFVGFAWSLCTLQWMRLGHWTMYGALFALSFYLSFYLPVFIGLSRRLTGRGVPLYLSVPMVWTSLEFLRAHLLTGFSWYYLGHTQYQWTSFVQIADLTGVYGISFLMAMFAAAATAALPASTLVFLRIAESESDVENASRTTVKTGLLCSVLLIAAACVYGVVRMEPPQQTAEGPVVAVVQGNFTPELKHDSQRQVQMVLDHDVLTRRAAGLRPDLIILPESMFPIPDQIIGEGVTDEDLVAYLNMHASISNSTRAQQEIERWHSGHTRMLLEYRSQEAGAAMMFGALTEVAEKSGRELFNSAVFVRPDLGYVGRYDKMHLVLFGEYIPLKGVIPWLEQLSPYGAGFGFDSGTQPSVFEYNGVRYSPVICFEDTVPHLVRHCANAVDEHGKQPDVLLNLTNDAWFRGSSELDQHLITSTFRCIENRRPMVRSVNAGISAFIDSSGRVRQPEDFLVVKGEEIGLTPDFEKVESMYDPATGARYRQCSAVMCGQLPLDGRSTVYGRFGDWFAILCSIVTIVLMARRASVPRQTPPGKGVSDFRTAA